MLTIREVIKICFNALLQRLKKHRGNWDQNDPSADDYIKNRPFYTDETNHVVKLDKKYLPDLGLAPVATSGDYWDLENIPETYSDVVRYGTSQSLTTAQKAQARTNIGAAATSDLATVANTGDYNDLKNKPCSKIYSSTRYSLSKPSFNGTFYSSSGGSYNCLNAECAFIFCKSTGVIVGEVAHSNCLHDDYLYIWGNASLITSEYGDTGETWCVFYNTSISKWSWKYGSATVPTLVIDKRVATITQLNEEFIPDTIARVEDIPAPVEYVHATANDDGPFTLDKTYDEIIAAYDAGRKVQCEMRFAADAGAGAYIFDLIAFGPYVPDVNDGDTVYNGALFVLWMQNRMMRMLVTTDNQVMMFQTNRFQTEGELQIRYGNELMYAGHMGVDVDIDLNIPINAPKDYVAFTDQVNGYIYYVSMRNGTLVSTCAVETIEVASMPTTVEYTAGDVFDPSGLTLRATRYDGTPVEVTNFTYDAPEMLTEDVTAIPVTYTDMGVAYTVDVPITVVPFDPEKILVDFEYTDNGEGTYTITGWKGTNNGEASTEMIIPNYSCIIV